MFSQFLIHSVTVASFACPVYAAILENTAKHQPANTLDSFVVASGPTLYVGGTTNAAKTDLSRVRVGDFNSDGLTDVYYVNGGNSTQKGVFYFALPGGGFQSIDGPPLHLGPDPGLDLRRVQLGDFNGDGLTDVYFVNGSGTRIPGDIWINHGDGSYNRIDGPALYIGNTTDGAETDLARVRVEDFNGDGLSDIYFINTYTGTVFLSQPNGGFRAVDGPTLHIGNLAQIDLKRVQLGDFNGDGLIDVYFVNGSQSRVAGDIWINRDNGNYYRIDAPALYIGGNPDGAETDLSRVHVSDFNGDGLSDIYFVNNSVGTVFLSQSDGSFRAINGPTLNIGPDPLTDLGRVQLGDFNGDGLTDVYFVNGGYNPAPGDIWLNHGDGTYNRIDAPAIHGDGNIDTMVYLNRVRLGDFDGNSLIDIYCIDGWGNAQPGQIFLNQEVN